MMTFWTTALVLVSMGSAIAQDVPPPPPMRGEAASLKDTMKFIEAKLPGKVNFMVYVHDSITGRDGTHKESSEKSNIFADADSCQISYHSLRIVEGATMFDKDVSILLKQIQEIVLMPKDQAKQREAAKGGHPEFGFKIDPPVFVLLVNSPKVNVGFEFYDETLADRVSKALQHAVELCGGGNQEPF
jgi:hypothetical protein